ncbi:hypothetical protein ATM97_05400 [Nocardia sp. MH4]|uniref:hypothetical protein n=1 Tax=Nocardia sp. MH4 TaxID=1768677 RepID=UPI001C4E7CA3|nr:hypothetical protein [Nocardia sp. MH4]MBW0275199.1 hypothetical protein [Nocardia sp. MH4]
MGATADRAPDLLVSLATWRAGHGVPDTDRRPTGPVVAGNAERDLQRHIDAQVTDRLGDTDADILRWAGQADELDVAGLTTDPVWPLLAADLSRAADSNRDIVDAVRVAAAARPLPAEQPAAALRWRLAADLDELPPAPAETSTDQQLQVMERDRLRRMSDTALDAELGRLRASLRQHQNAAIPHLADLHDGSDLDKVTTATRVSTPRPPRSARPRPSSRCSPTTSTPPRPRSPRCVGRSARSATGRPRGGLAASVTPNWPPSRRSCAPPRPRTATTSTGPRAIYDAAGRDGVPQQRWRTVLDAADDGQARAAELDAAREYDQARADSRQRFAHTSEELRGQLRSVVAEHRRRSELTDDERAREDDLRTYLAGPGRAVGVTGVSEHSEPEPRRIEPPSHQRPVYEPPQIGPDLGL